MLLSIAQARAAHQAAGGTWFAPDTMRYWGTRISSAMVYPTPDGGLLFVTSDRPGEMPRTFSVRHCSLEGRVNSLWLPVRGADQEWDDLGSHPFLELYRGKTAEAAHRVARTAVAAWGTEPAPAGGWFPPCAVEAASNLVRLDS